MATATINGVETAYEVHGSGTPVLFIHGGFGGVASSITGTRGEPNAQAIVEAAPLDRVELITYDRRCAGQSEYTIDEAYSLEDIAADARALLAHLGHERAVIIGSSMGGMVAQQYALSFPETVTALALLNTGPRLMFETPWGQRFREIVDRVNSSGAEAVFAEGKQALLEPPALVGNRNSAMAKRAAEGRAAYLEAIGGVSDEDLFRYWRGGVRNYAAFTGYDFTSRLGEIASIEAPKLIVHGDADSVVPFSDAEVLRAGLGEVEFHAIPGADHGITQYAEAQTVIRDWLERVA
jgi:3-oxoadipate enol-lactonase